MSHDPDVMFEALETLLVERKWLAPGELTRRADLIVAHRAALDQPPTGAEETEG